MQPRSPQVGVAWFVCACSSTGLPSSGMQKTLWEVLRKLGKFLSCRFGALHVKVATTYSTIRSICTLLRVCRASRHRLCFYDVTACIIMNLYLRVTFPMAQYTRETCLSELKPSLDNHYKRTPPDFCFLPVKRGLCWPGLKGTGSSLNVIKNSIGMLKVISYTCMKTLLWLNLGYWIPDEVFLSEVQVCLLDINTLFLFVHMDSHAGNWKQLTSGATGSSCHELNLLKLCSTITVFVR